VQLQETIIRTRDSLIETNNHLISLMHRVATLEKAMKP
jgi:hypothetical protein